MVLFAATGALSRTLAPEAVARGAVVIDKSNTFRMRPDVPLIVPEINAQALDDHAGIIANPNCTTTGVVMALEPIRRVRDSIGAGYVVGPRILVAGNIVGWGGPFSLTFSLIPSDELSLFQERMNDAIAQGAGEELMAMTPEELRVAINAYLDKGVDFVKYGGTAHFDVPALLGFSPAQQAVLVLPLNLKIQKFKNKLQFRTVLRFSEYIFPVHSGKIASSACSSRS